MPVLTDLDKQLNKVPHWEEAYAGQLPQAQRVAYNIPLVHVSGNPGRVSFVEVLEKLPYGIPTSEKAAGYSSDRTRCAERKLALGSCVYLYAGRAHPSFGKVALAFDIMCENKHTGSATPFDTGGLAARLIKWNLPNQRIATLREFTIDSTISLAQWRNEFARYLAAYFSPISSYWSGRPYQSDPEELFVRNEEDEWRVWVFEIRFKEPLSFFDATVWCTFRDYFEELRSESISGNRGAVPDSLADPLSRFLQIPTLEINEDSHPCDVMETWVLERVKNETLPTS
jgi:hypothetical protein